MFIEWSERSTKITMSTTAQRRLLKDLQRIQNEAGDQIIAGPRGSNLLKWSATIEGVNQTPWEGGLFSLKLDFTQSYPNKPPAVKFTSEMFHPNIYNDGRICLDMLYNQWSPIYDVWSILTAIRLLLGDPNPLSPANSIASKIFKENKILYEKKVREIVEKSLNQNEDDELKEEEEEKVKKQPEEEAENVEEDEDEQEQEEEAIPQISIGRSLASSYNPFLNRTPPQQGQVGNITIRRPPPFSRFRERRVTVLIPQGSESDSGINLRQQEENQLEVDESEEEVEEGEEGEENVETPEQLLLNLEDVDGVSVEQGQQAQEIEYDEGNANQDEQDNLDE